MSPLREVAGVLRYLGPRWAAFRVLHAGRMRLGVLVRRDPPRVWPRRADEAGFLSVAPRVFAGLVEPGALATALPDWDREAARPPVPEALALVGGSFRFFGWRRIELGRHPAWTRHPLTGESLPAAAPWSLIPEFAQGDIKLVWEPSRWGWAPELARAFVRTGDSRFTARLRELVDDWMERNPPGTGPNWKCGQEAALRLMSACAAQALLSGVGAACPEDLRRLAALAEVTANRIEANLAYALSQDNNHGLSELAGLLTAAVLFPALPGAADRRARVRRLLVAELDRLVLSDGSFAQYSVNYHRVLLQLAVWCGRLLHAAGEPFTARTLGRLEAAMNWMWQIMNPADGRVPCYGSNDGADILRLDGGEYVDHRAAVQAAAMLTRGAPVLPPGPWDETAAWLFGTAALAAPTRAPARVDFTAAAGGYHVLRRNGTDVFVRCGPHRFRPHHADQLHVAVRRAGRELTLDAGTHSYNAPPPYDHAFGSTRFHNTVTVDGQDQMERAGRFLWLPWSRGSHVPLRELADGGALCWEGETDAWRRLDVEHRRALLLRSNGDLIVLDRLRSAGEHRYRLHWLFPDGDLRAEPGDLAADLVGVDGSRERVAAATTGTGCVAGWVRGDEGSARGWVSPHYLQLVPAWSWEVAATGTQVWFVTHLGREPASLSLSPRVLLLDGLRVELGGAASLVSRVSTS